jgi:ParB-like chromosome segregation protein Spo0J
MKKHLEIVVLGVDELTPSERNAKLHPREQIEEIKQSVIDNGFNDPIAVWGENNLIVEGHGRWIACKELGFKEVECIRLDHLTEEQRRAYTLTHNKLTMNSGFDEELLELELEELQEIGVDVIGFELDEETPEEKPEREDLSEKVKAVFEVIVECEDEFQQEEIYNRLTEEGLTCRVLTL